MSPAEVGEALKALFPAIDQAALDKHDLPGLFRTT